MKIVIPGAAGAIGRALCKRLIARGDQVIGIDRRPWPDAPKELELHALDVRKRAAEDVLRRHRPDVVVHIGTVSHITRTRDDERYKINLGGTKAVFEHCERYEIPHVVFVGRHTYYGAGADAPLYHREDEPPLALSGFPELADLVAADLYAGAALWRVPEMITTVLRVCYTLGPSGDGTLATFLRGRRVPTILGFDPLFQFMHELDLVDALVAAVDRRPRGVFNVAGPPPLPLSTIIARAGRTRLPLPEFILAALLGHRGLPKLARGALTHLMHPVVIDDQAFRRATGFVPKHDAPATIATFTARHPTPAT
ncbi:MAG: SDR family oxidoreductase [Deltaproteobacteria bacterium]|nr:SDR family oxidoreductase [Deltaproteobacteria bacterium]